MSVEYDEEEYEDAPDTTRWVIAAVVAVALIAGAFFAGKAMAGSSGPATLAEAVTQAQAGDLPCGDTGTASATPDPQGGPPQGAGFAVRAICNRGQQGTNGGPPTGAGFAGRGGGFGFGGEVVSVTADKLTFKGQQGNITVTLGPSTTISKSSKAASSDLKPGQTVVVGGAGRQAQAGGQTATATSVLITGSAN